MSQGKDNYKVFLYGGGEVGVEADYIEEDEDYLRFFVTPNQKVAVFPASSVLGALRVRP